MKKLLLVIASLFFMTSCNTAQKAVVNDKFIITECSVIENKKRLNIVIEHKTLDKYSVVYDTVIALDDNLDINEKAPIAISTVVVTNENILGMGSSGGNSNSKSFASFNEDNNLIISSNIYYVYNDNETYDVEDAFDVMLTKVGSEYKAEIIKYSNK